MDNCKCINNSCIKCKDVELNKAKQKLDRYEQALKILMDDSIIQDTYLGNNNDGSNLFESVIMDKNMRGEVIKKHIKIKYITQLPTHNPSFAFYCNLPQYIREPYKRFLENRLREKFDFTGVTLQLFFRKK